MNRLLERGSTLRRAVLKPTCTFAAGETVTCTRSRTGDSHIGRVLAEEAQVELRTVAGIRPFITAPAST